VLSGSTPQRREVRYRGDVQGVGFRYTTVRVARGYEVTGFVRNEPDGSVRLVVEGVPAEIEAFLHDLADMMSGNIRDVMLQKLPATGEFSDFTIRR
jgi:acylphosphatase